MEAGSLLQEALLRQAERHELLSDDDDAADVLWIDVYLLPAISSGTQASTELLLKLAQLAQDLNQYFLACKFDWHVGGDGPVFGIHATHGIPHLRAICRYGANVADEWTAIALIQQYSAANHPEIVVECWDVQDGQVLLIESADVLPTWVDNIGPEAMRHRCWIQKGDIQLIAPTTHHDNNINLGLKEALQILQKGGPGVEVPKGVQHAIRDCVSLLVPGNLIGQGKDNAHTEADNSKISHGKDPIHHKAAIALPRPVAHLIRKRPDLVNAAIVAFAHDALQPPELHNGAKKKSSTTQQKSIVCEDWCWTTHSFSRTNYAMLRTLVSNKNGWTTETTVPKEYQSVELRRMQRQCAVEATPHLQHAVHIGVRLVAGLNAILAQESVQSSTQQSSSSSLVERRILQYWPRLLQEELGMEAQWLQDAWRRGPNHASHDISNIMKCPVVSEEFTRDNITPLSHPELSVAAQIRKELKKEMDDNDNDAFLVPRQDEVDAKEDWMLFTAETMEKQITSRQHTTNNADKDPSSSQQADDDEKEQVAELDTMLSTFQNFMVDKSGPEGVSHKHHQETPPSSDKDKLASTGKAEEAAAQRGEAPVQIDPSIFLHLLRTALDPSKSPATLLEGFSTKTNQGESGDDAFFSRDDYEAMLPDDDDGDHDDDDDEDGALDTDVVELMAAMDEELKGTAAGSSVNVPGGEQNGQDGLQEESRILMNLLQSLDAGEGGPGPVQSMMKAMGVEPPLVVSGEDATAGDGDDNS